MTDRRRTTAPRAPAARDPLGRSGEIAVMTVMVVAHLVQVSALLDLFVAQSTMIALAVQYATFAFYGYVAFARGQMRIVVVAVLFVLYLIWQSHVFASVSGYPMNANAALAYGALLMAVPFFVTRLPLGMVLRIILYVSIGYCLAYLLLAPFIAGASGLDSRSVLPSDGTRGARALLAGSFAAMVLFTGIAELRARPFYGLGLILIGGAAIFVAQSRVFQAVLAISFTTALIGTFVPALRRPLAVLLALIFLGLCGLILWGYVDNSWNPYSVVFDDNSGRARYLEYGDALRTIGSYWLTGVGVAPSNEVLQAFVQPRQPFFPGDLGPAGVFYQFGAIGTTLFVIGSVGAILSLPNRAVRESAASLGFHYTTLHAALYGFFAAILFGGSGTLFGALTFGLWLKGGYFSLRRAPTRERQAEIDPNAYAGTAGAPAAMPRRTRIG